jgi:hypothetical protein
MHVSLCIGDGFPITKSCSAALVYERPAQVNGVNTLSLSSSVETRGPGLMLGRFVKNFTFFARSLLAFFARCWDDTHGDVEHDVILVVYPFLSFLSAASLPSLSFSRIQACTLPVMSVCPTVASKCGSNSLPIRAMLSVWDVCRLIARR